VAFNPRLVSIACTLSLLIARGAWAAPVVTAEFAPPPQLLAFNVGAGMAIDPPAPTPFDNRLAQTFVAGVSGFPLSASVLASRSTSTVAPLWVDIVTLTGGQVSSVLASGSVPPSTFPTAFRADVLAFNGTIPLTATQGLIAGETYALVFRSAMPDANYRVFGAEQLSYPQGNALRSQNSLTFQAMSPSSDLFFQVMVEPVPEPAGGCLALLALVPYSAWRKRRIRRPAIFAQP
jgi:hypothetical protein